MRTLLWTILAVSGLMGPATLASAQEGTQPAVLLCFGGYDNFFDRVAFLGKLAGNENLGVGAEASLKLMLGGQGLNGLDTKRPWGAVMELRDGMPVIYGVVPTTNLKALVESLAEMPVPIREAGDGLYEISTNYAPLFAKQLGEWTYVVTNPDLLKGPIPNPGKALAELAQKYLLSLRINVAGVPKEMIAPYLEMLEDSFRSKVQIAEGETPAEFEARKAVSQQNIDNIRRVAADLDQVTLGLALDDQTRSAYLDIQVTAKAGTETAKQFAQSKATATHFAGFVDPGALFSGSWAGMLSDNQKSQHLAALDTLQVKFLHELSARGLPADVDKKLGQAIRDLIDVAKSTVKSGKLEGGLVAYYQASSVTAVLGGAVGDVAKLDQILKNMQQLAQREEPSIGQKIKLNVEDYKGLKLHTAQVPMPDWIDPAVTQLFGSDVDVAIALGSPSANPQSGYIAVGRDAMTALKQVVDRSQSQGEKAVPPVLLSLSLGTAAAMAGEIGPEMTRPQAQVAAALLSQTRGQDHLLLTVEPIERGNRARLELEKGVLQILGTLGQAAAPRMVPSAPGARPF